MIAAGYYFCKGTNMTDPQAAATKIRMGVVAYGIAMCLIFIGVFVTLGQLGSYGQNVTAPVIEVIVDIIISACMGYYMWNAALRFQGNRMVVAPTIPGQQYNRIPSSNPNDPYNSGNLNNTVTQQ